MNEADEPIASERTADASWRHNLAHSLITPLGADESLRTLGGNQPFPLDNSARVWFVLSGSVDIFLLTDGPSPASKGLHGVRHHLARIEAGAVIFALSERLQRFLAVPANGTEIAESSFSVLFELDPQHDQALTQSIEGWLQTITEGVGLASAPSVATEPEWSEAGNTRIAADSALTASKQVSWIEPIPAATVFSGIQPIASDEVGNRLPLVPGAWLTFASDTDVSRMPTTRWLHAPNARKDLLCYNRLVANRFSGQERQRRDASTERLERHRRYSGRRFGNALQTLFDVLKGAEKRAPTLSPNPTIAAVQLVANSLGFALDDPSALETRIRNDPEPVATIAHQSGFFYRTVVLQDEWWKQEHGPLLAFYGEERRPGALLPLSRQRYRWVDAGNGNETQVSAAVAGRIDRQCYALFRPFPETMSWNGWSLARFGIRGGGREIWMILAMVLLAGLLSLVTPLLTQWILDPVIPLAQVGQLTVMVCGVILAGLATVGFSLVQSIAMLRLEGRMVNAVQPAVWDRLLKLPAGFFQRFTVGDLANRAESIDAMRSLVSSSAVAMLVHSAIGLFSLGLMLYYNWMFAGLIALLAALFCGFAYIVARRVLLRNREVKRLSGRIQGMVFQFLSAISKLRASGAEGQAYAKWAEQYGAMQSIIYDQRNISNGLVVSQAFFQYFALIALLTMIGWKGGALLAFYQTPDTWRSITSEGILLVMPIAEFGAFYVAFGQFLSAMFGVTHLLVELVDLKPLLERVQPILHEATENEGGAVISEDVQGEVQFHEVCYRYQPDAPLVLDRLSFRAIPGQFIALVGPSGAGKSTIVRLLLGFDNPESGSVFIDSRQLAQLDKPTIRRYYGVVLQAGKILSGSIFNNIAAGALLSRDEAWEAARTAGLDKDIEAMPMGMETLMSEGASTLSGGQRQRLMIARAVVRKPKILILDEATSALDNETQEAVSQGIEALRTTRIVIAHRLSTIVHADYIYVIDQGRVIEEGTYRHLLHNNGLFSELAKRQMA